MRVLILSLLVLFCPGALAQTTLNVPSAGYPTIQSAINAASSGDTVQVAAGIYVENVVWPAFDIHLLGSGPETCVIDGNQSGSCVRFTANVDASILEGFKLTNGSGSPGSIGTTTQNLGGGLQIIGGPPLVPSMSPTIRNCEISGNIAVEGGGVMLRSCSPTFENCLIQNNAGTSAVGLTYAARGIGVYAQVGAVTFQNCTFRQNGGGEATCRFSDFVPDVEFLDCTFVQNTTDRIIQGNFASLSIKRNVFSSNVGLATINAAGISSLGDIKIDSCIFDSNVNSHHVVWLGSIAPNGSHIQNSTFSKNTVGVAPIGVLGFNDTTHVTNCIVQGNFNSTGGAAKTFHLPNGLNGSTAQHSNLEGVPSGLGIGLIDVDPQFADPLNGDLRLKPGSPMIDAGSLTPPSALSSTDVRGLLRVRGAGVDMGAYESQSLAHHPASVGKVGQSAGGPYDILTMNNSTGGDFRRIEASIGASASLEVAQPPHLSGPLHFSVFGIFGEGNFDTVVSVGLGIGEMMILPAPALPFLHPSFFTLASSVGPIGFYAPLFPASPTPWASGPGPIIPFPLLITIQGVLEESPGVFVPTNALIYEVK